MAQCYGARFGGPQRRPCSALSL